MDEELQRLKEKTVSLLVDRLRANGAEWHEIIVEEVLTDFARNLCHVIAGIVANELPLSIKSRVMELSRKLPVG